MGGKDSPQWEGLLWEGSQCSSQNVTVPHRSLGQCSRFRGQLLRRRELEQLVRAPWERMQSRDPKPESRAPKLCPWPPTSLLGQTPEINEIRKAKCLACARYVHFLNKIKAIVSFKQAGF